MNSTPDPLAHRKGSLTIQVVTPSGSPLANQEVEIRQTRHRFLFGSAGYDIALANGETPPERREQAELRTQKMVQLCNAATLPFYWGGFEPVRGQPDTVRLQQAARSCVKHGMRVKGHPLCWHTVTADWLMALSNAEILEVQLGRIRREVSEFRGLIDLWDVINEVVIMPIFDKYDNGITRICKELGRINLVRKVFAEARDANPGATLLLNDFDMSPAYDILVEGCLEAGIPIDVIGIQSHMHQGYWGVEKTQRVLEQFSRFRLPLHFTETNLVSGELMPPEIVDLNDFKVSDWPTTPQGEERQAREALTHYRTLFDSPLVEGITWWDFSDGGWLNAPAGLLRKDASSKPAYDELLKLIKGEWWTHPIKAMTDAAGNVSFNGFLGDYELESAGAIKRFKLEKGAEELQVRL
jgi:endo-1,4-beta-xylanase